MFYIIKSLRKSKIFFLLICLLCVVSPFAAILTSEFMGKLTDHFTQYGLTSAGYLVLLTIMAYALEDGLQFFYQDLNGRMQAYFYSAMQKKTFLKLANLPVDAPIMLKSSDLYNRFSNDTNEVTNFLSTVVPEILMQTSYIIITLFYLFLADWRVTTIYFISVICSVAIQGVISVIMKKTGKKVKTCEVDMNTSLQDMLGGRIIIKTYGAYCFAENRCKKSSQRLVKTRIRLNLLAMPLRTVGILCGMFPILSVCIASLYLIPRGLLDIGNFLSIFYLCKKIVPKQLHYVDLIVSAVKTKPAVERIVMLWRTEAKDGEEREYLVRMQDGMIICKDAWYRYPENEDWAVRELSIEIAPGRKVAFVGESGSGKSTMLKLISGLVSPQKGIIAAEGSVLNRQFSYLFSTTIKENVSFGKASSEIMDDFVFWKTCETAELKTVIEQANQGIETELHRNGSNLSGGQRQRIAIARTLYSEAKILLFDEPVSALDSQTSQKVIKQILECTGDATVVMVLHQKELLHLFDEVYTFSKGSIIDHVVQRKKREEEV